MPAAVVYRTGPLSPVVAAAADGPAAAARVALLLAAVAAVGAAAPIAAHGQDSNVLYPVAEIEARLRAPALRFADVERARMLEVDRSRRTTLIGMNGEPDMVVHWKPVAPPGEGFNNEPRYELAAYRLQQLFLDEHEYVVPPVVLRAMPIEEAEQYRSVSGRVIRGTRSVLFLLSYWVQNLAVDTVDPFDAALFERSPSYALNFANANILTHLIEHKDSNHGNVLVSMNPENRRVFSVDNDVAFRSERSDLGTRWRQLVVKALPARTVDRLRTITGEQLREALAVLAEFENVDGYLVPVAHGPNLASGRGVRHQGGRMQFGLTEREIRDVEARIERLIRDVDRGRFPTF